VDLVVTNGGWGECWPPCGPAVPLVVAAGLLDKAEVARRVAWSGVGLDLRTECPEPQSLRRAIAPAHC
jgi:UDP:flavonoid glycosyltransferase YjiC (YdhE family)